MTTSYFITATDTGVGKTLVTGALAWCLRERGEDVGCYKPVQSGDLLHDETGDVCRLQALAGLTDPVERIGRYAFAEPLAPRLAAERAGSPLMLDDLLSAFAEVRGDHARWLVEGAGGLAVPLTTDATVADFAAQLGFPLLIVARANLGTVNHTVLTVRYAESLGLSVAGVILSGGKGAEHDLSESFNATYIEEYANVPILGHVPWLGDQPSVQSVRDSVREHVDLQFVDSCMKF